MSQKRKAHQLSRQVTLPLEYGPMNEKADTKLAKQVIGVAKQTMSKPSVNKVIDTLAVLSPTASAAEKAAAKKPRREGQGGGGKSRGRKSRGRKSRGRKSRGRKSRGRKSRSRR
jgi:hypothetical protein